MDSSCASKSKRGAKYGFHSLKNPTQFCDKHPYNCSLVHGNTLKIVFNILQEYLSKKLITREQIIYIVFKDGAIKFQADVIPFYPSFVYRSLVCFICQYAYTGAWSGSLNENGNETLLGLSVSFLLSYLP